MISSHETLKPFLVQLDQGEVISDQNSKIDPHARVEGWTLIKRLSQVRGVQYWHANHPHFGGATLKLIWPQAFSEDPTMWTFNAQLELERLQQVDHPALQRIMTWGSDEKHECWFTALEEIQGHRLSDLIQKEPVSLENARTLFLTLAEGIIACHSAEVLHRRIEPESIYITQKGPRLAFFNWVEEVKAADVSVAERLLKAEMASYVQGMLAPEWLDGAEITEASDLYALGSALLASVNPQAEGWRDAPHELKGVIAQALNQDPKMRGTLQDFYEGLRLSTLSFLYRGTSDSPAERMLIHEVVTKIRDDELAWHMLSSPQLLSNFTPPLLEHETQESLEDPPQSWGAFSEIVNAIEQAKRSQPSVEHGIHTRQIAELSQQATKLKERERALQALEETLQQREADLEQREFQISDISTILEGRATQQSKRERQLSAQKMALSEAVEEYQERASSLRADEENLNEKREALSQERARLEIELAEQAEILQTRAQELEDELKGEREALQRARDDLDNASEREAQALSSIERLTHEVEILKLAVADPLKRPKASLQVEPIDSGEPPVEIGPPTLSPPTLSIPSNSTAEIEAERDRLERLQRAIDEEVERFETRRRSFKVRKAALEEAQIALTQNQHAFTQAQEAFTLERLEVQEVKRRIATSEGERKRSLADAEEAEKKAKEDYQIAQGARADAERVRKEAEEERTTRLKSLQSGQARLRDDRRELQKLKETLEEEQKTVKAFEREIKAQARSVQEQRAHLNQDRVQLEKDRVEVESLSAVAKADAKEQARLRLRVERAVEAAQALQKKTEDEAQAQARLSEEGRQAIEQALSTAQEQLQESEKVKRESDEMLKEAERALDTANRDREEAKKLRSEAEKNAREAERLQQEWESRSSHLSPSDERSRSDSGDSIPSLQIEGDLTPQINLHSTGGEVSEMSIGALAWRLRYCPPGHCLIGASDQVDRPEETPQHTIQLSTGLWLAETPITRALWAEVMGPLSRDSSGDDHPVEGVKWVDAIRFCNRLSRAMNLTPAYEIGGGGRPLVYWNQDANGFRLPSEAEWEYAARSGGASTTLYAGGDELDAVGWYGRNAKKSVQEVGQKKPTKWGLNDLSGNVWEWCQDAWTTDAYRTRLSSGGEIVDPVHYFPQYYPRVVRGGSVYERSAQCTVTARPGVDPDNGYGVGLRPCLPDIRR